MVLGWISGGSKKQKYEESVKKTETETLLHWSYETDGEVYSVSISSDGSYIAAGSWDGTVYFFAFPYIDAKIAISSARAAISSIKSSGYAVVQAEGLLKQAEEAFEAGDYSKAKELANEAKIKAEQIQEAAKEASEAIENARAAISSAPPVVGFIAQRLSYADSLLRQAEEAYAEGDYQTSRRLAIEARGRAVSRSYLALGYLGTFALVGIVSGTSYGLYRRWKRAREEYERAKAEVIRELEEVIAMLEERSRRA